ncbi:MAG: [Oscillospiraceae bacterium]|nr:[FeFe] hydrogenase H-cluster radical SAM maturase HydE [Oscillospiraceae bacterium]
MSDCIQLVQKLAEEHRLTLAEYETLLRERSDALAAALREQAVRVRQAIYGNAVFTRGLIEISSYCKNNCFYCGIRAGNPKAERYRLTPEEILECCREGWTLGFRTFVLQGGEDPFFTDEVLCPLLRQIKQEFPDCAITLSLGERSRNSYQALFDAGADRYLLRHETADKEHYAQLHPASLSWEHRMACLTTLKEIGYQVGCGFMVGSPGQTERELAKDLKFVETFRPAMCGIGPFIPHRDTPFAEQSGGSVELTCYLLSILRLMQPNLLLPATTALGTLDPIGREKGVLAGANVVMPNLSPVSVRKKYALYDNKICTGEESAQCRGCLERRMQTIGYSLVTDRGDPKQI